MTASPGSGSAAATTTSGKVSRSRAPVPISVPPVPRPGNEDVDPVERIRDLGAGAFVVRARVRLVRVLERHEPGRVALRELEREPDGAVGALVARRVDDLGAEQAQDAAALGGRVLGQHAGERVALQLRDERERDAGVAARRLEQAPTGLELAGRLGRFDHRLRDAVFDRAGGILCLELREDADRPGREARELDERSVADEVEDARCERVSAHRPWPVGESASCR